MSKKKRKNPQIPSEQATLPIQADDTRNPQTNTHQLNDENVVRAKRWVDEHET